MILVHIELSEANAFIVKHHRHHKRIPWHRFSIGAVHEGQLVGDLRLFGEQLADIEAGDVGLDWLELTAILGRGLRLEVVHIDVRRAARKDHHDHGFAGRSNAGGSLPPEDISQREAAATQRPGSQKIAAAVTVAIGVFSSQDTQHNRSFMGSVEF